MIQMSSKKICFIQLCSIKDPEINGKAEKMAGKPRGEVNLNTQTQNTRENQAVRRCLGSYIFQYQSRYESKTMWF